MCALGVSLKREPLLPAVNEVEQRGGVYRPRHNGVIVTSGRGVVGGMAVGREGLVRDHNAGECQRGGAALIAMGREPWPKSILLNYINPL